MSAPDPTLRDNLLWGWGLLSFFMLGGLLLEGLHALKLALYFENALRRELWVLAHAHGALLALVNLAFVASAATLIPEAPRRSRAGRSLRWGALLMPLGFFLGGIGNSESDPSLAILLTPIGALMVLHAVASCAVGAWRLARR